MAKKKLNPRNRPATIADVKRAKSQATDAGTRIAMAIMFTVLADKQGFDLERMRETWEQVLDLSDSVAERRVSIADLCCVLREEYDIKIL